MRHIASVFAALAALLLLAAPGRAQQSYPDKPVRMVVPWPPGGSVDIVARLVSEKLGQRLAQPIIIQNSSGASGTIGMDMVAKARPDGYTLLINTIPLATNPALFAQLPFDTVKDFAPIALIAKMPHLLVSTQAITVGDMRELLNLAKSRPGRLTYSSAGSGSTTHLSALLFSTMSRTDILHIPYRGGGPALADAVSGQVDISFPSFAAALPFVKTGRIKALAITSASRSPLMPDRPTGAEAGLPGYEFTAWFMLRAPAATPRDIVGRVNQAVTETMKSPDVAERFAREGTEIVSGTPDRAAAFLAAEIGQWAQVIKERGIKMD